MASSGYPGLPAVHTDSAGRRGSATEPAGLGKEARVGKKARVAIAACLIIARVQERVEVSTKAVELSKKAWLFHGKAAAA